VEDAAAKAASAFPLQKLGKYLLDLHHHPSNYGIIQHLTHGLVEGMS
jgi:hypothetical protein